MEEVASLAHSSVVHGIFLEKASEVQCVANIFYVYLPFCYRLHKDTYRLEVNTIFTASSKTFLKETPFFFLSSLWL